MASPNVITRACARCGKPMQVMKASSLTRQDGTPWRIYHGDCYRQARQEEQK